MNDLKMPIIRPGELIRALEKLGFSCTKKSKGSHFRYKHPDGRKTTVPVTPHCSLFFCHELSAELP
jgi:predicted RNA binding protein YcfA (HicA-like mRNA interferase family)